MAAQLGIKRVAFAADVAGHLDRVLGQAIRFEWLDDFWHNVRISTGVSPRGLAFSARGLNAHVPSQRARARSNGLTGLLLHFLDLASILGNRLRRRRGEVANAQRAAEADVVLAAERIFTAGELARGLIIEIGIERAAANRLKQRLVRALVGQRGDPEEIVGRPFPNVANELIDAADAHARGKLLDRHSLSRARSPQVR